MVRLFIETEQMIVRCLRPSRRNSREEDGARKTLPLTDLRDDRADLRVDDVGLASNDVPVIKDAPYERLAGRMRPQVSREAGRPVDRQVRLDDEQRGFVALLLQGLPAAAVDDFKMQPIAVLGHRTSAT